MGSEQEMGSGVSLSEQEMGSGVSLYSDVDLMGAGDGVRRESVL